MAAAALMAEGGAGRLYSRKQEGSGASRCPGSMVRSLRAEPWAFPTERAGSEGREKVLKIDGAFAPRVLRFDSPFGAEGCGGGWRRKYIRCLSAAVVDAFKNERRHDDKTEESPCRRSPVVWFFHSAERNYKTHRPKGDTTTLGAAGAVNPKNPKNLRPGGPSTLTPERACPKPPPPSEPAR
jgi:hypothetical protein